MIICGLGLGLFNPPRAFLSIGVVEPRKAGMASGVNETFQQVGVALGIAALGAFFQARVAGSFTSSAAGKLLGPQAHSAADAVAAGAGDQVTQTAPPGAARAVADAARTAVVDGLGDALLVGAILAAVGAAFGFLYIRGRDLHESARTAVPGVPPDTTEADVDVDAVPAAVGSGRETVDTRLG
jgi:hypothetical protein